MFKLLKLEFLYKYKKLIYKTDNYNEATHQCEWLFSTQKPLVISITN